MQGTNSPAEEHRRGPSEQASTTTWIWPHLRVNTSPAGGLGATVGTLRQEYPLLQDNEERTQERQPRTTGPDPRGQVPNLRGPDLGLYKWKPDFQEA